MKKIVCMILSLMLILVLSACGSESPETESTVSDVSSGSPSKIIVNSNPNASSDASAASGSSASSQEPVSIEDMTNMNLLTGLPTLSEKAIGKRPVAVMVNNLPDALPQYGISDADIIFELPVEADITRLMAVYGDYTKIPDVCSIRSCRYYYPILAVGFDAFYVHAGIDPTIAKQTVDRLDINTIDGAYAEYGLFARDQSRINSGYALEHTAVFYGTGLADALEKDDVRLDLKEEKRQPAFLFAQSGSEIVPAGEEAKNINIVFSSYYSNVDFAYNEETGTYDKYMNGNPHMDGVTGKQLTFENVIMLETAISVRDDKGRKNIDIYGGNGASGYYASKGKIQKIHWEKPGDYDYLSFTDENGNPLEINRGKTYIAFDYPDRVTYN